MQPAGLQAESPVAGSPEQAPVVELRVQAIKREGRRHSAVINGQVVRVGGGPPQPSHGMCVCAAAVL